MNTIKWILFSLCYCVISQHSLVAIPPTIDYYYNQTIDGGPWILKDQAAQLSYNSNTTMPSAWYLQLYQLMKDLHELFTFNKLEYWVQGGTLLGAVRHKGIIPWDDDIDMNIQKKDTELFISLIPALEKINYTVAPVWFGFKIATKEVFTFGSHKGSPCVDLFFTKEDNNKIYYDKHWMKRDGEPIYITKNELYPLKAYPFGDIVVLGPNNPIPYLDASFTKDWPYYGRIWNHFLEIKEEKELTADDLYFAQPAGPLYNRISPNPENPIRVYASMVADLFHYGHVEFLKQAHSLGTHLIVGLISDNVATTYKRTPILLQEERMKVMNGCKYVDFIIENAPLVPTKDFIAQHNIDFVVHGDDFKKEQLESYFYDPIAMNIMRIVPYTEGISTTQIINRIKKSFCS